MFMDTNDTQGRNQAYQNLMHGGAWAVRCYSQAGQPLRSIDVVNNTAMALVVNGEIDGMLTDWHSSNADNAATWRMHNNIKVGAAPLVRFSYTPDTAMLSRSHNLASGQNSNNWGYATNRGQWTLAQWQAAGFDASSLSSSPQLVSSTWGSADLGKLGASSPARLAGVDLLNLRGLGTSAQINIGAFITADNSDVLGIRALA
jgi:hypothetical protein